MKAPLGNTEQLTESFVNTHSCFVELKIAPAVFHIDLNRTTSKYPTGDVGFFLKKQNKKTLPPEVHGWDAWNTPFSQVFN